MSSQPDLGIRLGELRRRAGLSQAKLAGDQLTASYVSLIEAGKRTPNAHVLELLAERLGCTVDYLRDGVEAKEREAVELGLRYAELARRSGDVTEAWRRFGELAGDAAADALGRRPDALLGLARCAMALGQLEAAAATYEELRRLAEDDPTVPTWWPATVGLCSCHRLIGDLTYAVEIGEAAIARLRTVGLLGTDMGVQVVATTALAYWERGDLGRAQVLLDDARERAERIGSRAARGAAYWNASIVAQEQNRIGEALLLAERALALVSEGDDERWQAQLLEVHGWLSLRLQPPQPREALDILQQAAARLAALGDNVDLALCETEIARAQLLLGDPATAASTAGEALRRLRGGHRLERARARIVLAAALYARDNRDAARQAYAAAAHDLELAGASRQAAAAWVELATVAEDAGEQTLALDAYRRATAAAGVRPTATRPVAAPERQPTSTADHPPVVSDVGQSLV